MPRSARPERLSRGPVAPVVKTDARVIIARAVDAETGARFETTGPSVRDEGPHPAKAPNTTGQHGSNTGPDVEEPLVRPSGKRDDPRAPGASPRCDGRPGCGPDPTPRFDRCYREGGERKPLRVSTSRYFPHPGGACEHDGECRLGGCRDSCLSYRRSFYDFDCAISHVRYDPPTPTLPDRTDLLCGCVEGQCMFFSQ